METSLIKLSDVDLAGMDADVSHKRTEQVRMVFLARITTL